eukprot:8069357-Alexandrium_andersonii.AAC.1
MSAPTSADWAALARLTRYLIQRPRRVYHFPLQDEGAVLRACVDADFCPRARRSTCGGACV